MRAPRRLSHVDSAGQARMVDVSEKSVTLREARATATVVMSEAAFAAAAAGDLPKGDLLAVVRLAGVMAAKRTHELVPMCHPLRLTGIEVDAVLDPALPGISLSARVRCIERTGAEMEALTACAVAGLTAIDMVKAIDPWTRVEALSVAAKKGGRGGARSRPGARPEGGRLPPARPGRGAGPRPPPRATPPRPPGFPAG